MKRMIDGIKANELLNLSENVVANGTTTQVGGDLEVDGKIIVNSIDDIKAGNVYLQQRLTAGNNIKITGNKIEAEIDHNIYKITFAFSADVEGMLVISGLSVKELLSFENGIAKAVSAIVGTSMTWETASAYISNNWANITTDYRTALFINLFSECFKYGFRSYWRVADGAISEVIANYSSLGHVYALTAAGAMSDVFSSILNSTSIVITDGEVE